jgi:acyl-CoA thioesterase-1
MTATLGTINTTRTATPSGPEMMLRQSTRLFRSGVSAALVLRHRLRCIGILIVPAWLLIAGDPFVVHSQPIRIMPLGDSITASVTGNASYRYYLWQRLQSAGYQVDFVGSQYGVYGGPPLYTDFDQDHEGHWGWRVDEILANIDVWALAALPDIVLIHLGHNDLWQGQSVGDTIDELARIIDALRLVNPSVQILLAQVIPSTEDALAEIPSLNAQIPALVAAKTTSQSLVIAVDQYSGFDAPSDTWDGVHPNATGEQKIADRWFTWLARLLSPACLQDCLRSATIRMRLQWFGGPPPVGAMVVVRDENGSWVQDATVDVAVTLPDGSILQQSASTSLVGYAMFEITRMDSGPYSIQIMNIMKAGYRFDIYTSVLIKSFTR